MFLVSLILALVGFASARDRSYAGDALDLTRHARDGDYLRAQEASRVSLGNLTSYAGFVETTPGKHMYFWFFPAQNKDPNAPLLIWLQGGPGGSSLFGLFAEMGPFSLDEDLNLVERPTTWNKEYGCSLLTTPSARDSPIPTTLRLDFATTPRCASPIICIG